MNPGPLGALDYQEGAWTSRGRMLAGQARSAGSLLLFREESLWPWFRVGLIRGRSEGA
jgi:hypothetical protein